MSLTPLGELAWLEEGGVTCDALSLDGRGAMGWEGGALPDVRSGEASGEGDWNSCFWISSPGEGRVSMSCCATSFVRSAAMARGCGRVRSLGFAEKQVQTMVDR